MTATNINEVPLIKKDLYIMSESIKRLEEDMKAHRSDEALRHKEFQDFKEDLFERLETKFASKWVEKSMVAIFSTIWLALLWAILALILK